MPDPRRLRSVLGLLAVVVLALAAVAAPAARPATAAEKALPAWTGGVNLYRSGVFTTQGSWLWCTAAGLQIARNIVDHRADHTTTGQRRYFTWMRARNRYDLPLSAGVDAAGWTAGLRHFVDDRYRLVSSATFDGALRTAVTRLRLTGLPVALTVSHGNHGWILTGFQATADPARTSSFRVTSVRVTGPLYGLQSSNGYDMPPNTKLTMAQLRHYFTPWKYAPLPMVWDGRYVSIQPVPKTSSGTSKAPAPRASAKATASPHPSANPSAVPSGVPSPSATPLPAPSASVASSAVAVAAVEPSPQVPDGAPATAGSGSPGFGLLVAAILVATGVVAAVIATGRRRRPETTAPPS